MHAAEVKGGRPSIAREKLLRAMLLQVLYSLRSGRQIQLIGSRLWARALKGPTTASAAPHAS
jgi:transposase